MVYLTTYILHLYSPLLPQDYPSLMLVLPTKKLIFVEESKKEHCSQASLIHPICLPNMMSALVLPFPSIPKHLPRHHAVQHSPRPPVLSHGSSEFEGRH